MFAPFHPPLPQQGQGLESRLPGPLLLADHAAQRRGAARGGGHDGLEPGRGLCGFCQHARGAVTVGSLSFVVLLCFARGARPWALWPPPACTRCAAVRFCHLFCGIVLCLFWHNRRYVLLLLPSCTRCVLCVLCCAVACCAALWHTALCAVGAIPYVPRQTTALGKPSLPTSCLQGALVANYPWDGTADKSTRCVCLFTALPLGLLLCCVSLRR